MIIGKRTELPQTIDGMTEGTTYSLLGPGGSCNGIFRRKENGVDMELSVDTACYSLNTFMRHFYSGIDLNVISRGKQI